jgi:ABC-type maltose transport system permease subunit
MTTSVTTTAVRTNRRQFGIRARRRISLTIKMIVAILAAVFALVPIIFVVSAALNPTNTVSGASLIPNRITFDHFAALFNDPFHPWPLWMVNSFTVATITSVIVVGLCALAAYSFSRFRFRGRRLGLISLVIVQLFPNLLAIVALFLLLQAVGKALPETLAVGGITLPIPRLGLNSLGGLILIYIGGALGFNTWLMKAYFDTVPFDLDESARVDGASHFQAFRYVVLPLVRPILAVIAILTFIGTYSDFLFARVILSDASNYTLAVGMTLFIQGEFSRQWGVFAAAAVIGALPIVATFLVLQRQLIGGLSSGGVKG